jgi:hypothetical protein
LSKYQKKVIIGKNVLSEQDTLYVDLNFSCKHIFIFSVNITYIDRSGEKIAVKGKVGDNVMYLAHRYGIELEGKYFSFEIYIYIHVM